MKKALLVVSFGTSYKETREKTLNKCAQGIRQAFVGYDLFEAYTSKVIIKKIAQVEGLHIDTEEEVLEKMYRLGYQEVVVQPLYVTNGTEFLKLKKVLLTYQDRFVQLRLGMPLLTNDRDYTEVIQSLKVEMPLCYEGEGIVWMGHGSEERADTAYSLLEKYMKIEKLPAYVGTLEGSKNLEEVIRSLKEDKIHTVYLVPFMLVAGTHAIKDMASEAEHSWKNILSKEGFNVYVRIKGLGEYQGIRKNFIKHAKEAKELKLED